VGAQFKVLAHLLWDALSAARQVRACAGQSELAEGVCACAGHSKLAEGGLSAVEAFAGGGKLD
jgi:hypothetical protein